MNREVEGDGRAAPTRVFLSYARLDRERIQPLIAGLEQSGLEVWWDARIEGGALFAKSIAAALENSDAVLVVWSRASVESNWVLDEAMHGRDRRRLIPVSFDGSESPLGFRQFHTIDLSAWSGDPRSAGWVAVLQALGAITGTALPLPPHRGADDRVTRRRVIAGGAGLVLAVAGGGAYLAWRRVRPAAASNSVAVLPFRSLSADQSQDFFSDGLAEEMRIALSRNLQLQVAAQTSSNVFRDRRDSAQFIAAQLGVAFLLDGSVRRAQDVVRISVSLIDAATGFNRWSQVFDRTLEDIFVVQSEIALTVAATLAAQIATLKRNPGGTTNVQAFDAYLKGRALYHLDAGEPSDRAALALLETAIAADPDYAVAHAARARALVTVAGQYASADALPGLYDAAEAAARRAVVLAPEVADCQSALADVLFAGRLKVHAAREPYDRAHEFGSGDAEVLSAFAFYCAQTGRDADAGAAVSRALLLDPLNARAYRMSGWVHYAAHRYADAVPPLERALKMNAKLSSAHASLGDAFFQLGRTDEARDAYAAEPSDPFRLTGLAITERKLGHEAAAQSAQTELVAKLGDSALYQQAQVAAQWGGQETALGRLSQALKVGDEGLLYSHRDPLLDPLRGDARFQQLQRDLGFE